MVLTVTAMVTIAFAVIQGIRESSQSARAAHFALMYLEKETDELESLSWRAFALRGVPKREELVEPRADIERAFRVLETHASNPESVSTLRRKLGVYDRRLRGEMELVASGASEKARLRHLVVTARLYEDLDASLDVVASLQEARARSAERTADLGIAATLSIAALALISLFARLNSYRDALARERERRLLEEAIQDPLTGLANRRALLADLSVAVREPSVLVLLDLDGFKRYNDTFGHSVGDLLLNRIAEKLTTLAAPGRAYRLGGDEFCVLAAAEHRDRLERELGDLEEAGDGFSIGASFGAVSMPEDTRDAKDALAKADRLMYQQKCRRQSAREPGAYELARGFLSERFPWMADRSSAVAALAISVGQELGFGDAGLDDLRRAAVLRDVGKVALPDSIVGKPDRPDDDEALSMRCHSVIGDGLLSACTTLAPIAEIVRATHERWDGTGYPDRLVGDRIPLESRIIFVCDAYSAMISECPYRLPLSPQAALHEIKLAAGTRFDPRIVAAFERVQLRGGVGVAPEIDRIGVLALKSDDGARRAGRR